MNNQKEMFPASIVTKDTPRRAWLKRHAIQTHEWKECEDPDEMWCCWSTNDSKNPNEESATIGATEHDAIAAWAIKKKIRLWNEEGFQ